MMQRRWLELMKDNDLTIIYPLGEPNMVTDTLCKKFFDNTASLITAQKEILEDGRRMELQLDSQSFCALLVCSRL